MSFMLIFSILFNISIYDSDSLLNVLGEYLENFPVPHFVEIFILSFGVINLNFCYVNVGKTCVS